jgi:F-type H+-transporting ATPase subunit delta
MLNNPAAKEYARAIFDMATERESVEAVEDQLKTFVQACRENDELGKFFYNPLIPVPAKRDVVLKLFGQVLADFVGKFLLLVIDKRREALLPAILEEYEQLADKLRNICRVEVTTAMPMDEEQKQSFITKLSGITGRNVELLTAIDKRLLGGAVLQIGDRRVDGSVLSHLDQLKAVLLKKEATGIEVTS